MEGGKKGWKGGREGGRANLFYSALQWVQAFLPLGRLFEGGGEAERGEVRAAAVELGVGGVDPVEGLAGGREGGREGGRQGGREGGRE